MNRTKKREQVDAMHERFAAAGTAFVVDFQGLAVEDDTDLRNQLRQVEVDYRVVKNRLALLALGDTPLAGLGDHFQGPTAVATSQGDPAARSYASWKAWSFPSSSRWRSMCAMCGWSPL